MPYTKTSWIETTARSLANLNNLETQYDEAIADAITLRADNTEELRVEVLASLPAAGTAGRLVFNSGNNTLYVDDGTDFRSVGASVVKAITVYDVIIDTTDTYTDTTISAVDLGATVLTVARLGISSLELQQDQYGAVECYFTSTTNIRTKRYRSSHTDDVYFQVTAIEFEPGFIKSLQSDDSVELSAGNNDITISSVTTSKCLVILSWSSAVAGNKSCKAALTSGTNLRITAPATVSSHYASYFVVEFY